MIVDKEFEDLLWDALRQICCSTKPYTSAKKIILLNKSDLHQAIKEVKWIKEKNNSM